MKYGIFIHHIIAAPDMPIEAWLMDYDVNANSGAGGVTITRMPQKAKAFPTVLAAMDAWQTQSTVKPMRMDGKPNRPLTAYTVSITPIPGE